MKFYLDSVGCRLNQAEIEQIAGQLMASGHELVARPTDADIVIINTCTVTNEAASDSRQMLRQAARSGNTVTVATGCLVSMGFPGNRLDSKTIIQVPNSQKDTLVAQLGAQLDFPVAAGISTHNIVPGKRKRTRAFIKVQDGCDQQCTYCITRLVRGRARSIAVQDVIRSIQLIEEAGVKEAVLCGVQLGAWGSDVSPVSSIARLVIDILKSTTIPRLRLSSIEPWGLTEEFFHLWEDNRLCRQLHLPLQSGSDRILKRMGRKNSVEEYMEIVEKIRRVSPDISLTTDILVGFPGESLSDFKQTSSVIQQIRFAGGHVFSFSARQGTPAFQMAEAVNIRDKKERNAIIRNEFSQLKRAYYSIFLGQQVPVLWEQSRKSDDRTWSLSGWSDNYIRVKMESDRDLYNQISPVKLVSLEEDVVNGKEESNAGDGARKTGKN